MTEAKHSDHNVVSDVKAKLHLKDNCIFIPDNFGNPLKEYCVPKCYAEDLDVVLVSQGLIFDRIKKMAQLIQADVGNAPLTCLCVLKGSYRVFSALTEELINLRQECDYHLVPDFIRVQSYANTESTGHVDILGWEVLVPLRGQNVLIVEDLIDTGLTMQCLLAKLQEEQPASIRVATLAIKRTENTKKYQPDYVGFSLPNKFVVGFGLDYNQHMRDLNHICVMNQQGVDKYRDRPLSRQTSAVVQNGNK